MTLVIAVSLSTNFAGNDANELAQADAYQAGHGGPAGTAKAPLAGRRNIRGELERWNQTPAVAAAWPSRFLAG